MLKQSSLAQALCGKRHLGLSDCSSNLALTAALPLVLELTRQAHDKAVEPSHAA